MTTEGSNTVAVPVHELRALIRIATELRDPRWKDDAWVRNLAAACGLDLSNPEGLAA